MKTVIQQEIERQKANEIYAVNPYGEDKNDFAKEADTLGEYAELCLEYDQAQQNVGKWVMLRGLI